MAKDRNAKGPNAKEVQFKIMNKYYPVVELLKKRFGFEIDPCCFCLEEPETVEHRFIRSVSEPY